VVGDFATAAGKIENDLGIESHFRQAQNEAQCKSAHDEHDRIWQRTPARDHRQRRHGRE